MVSESETTILILFKLSFKILKEELLFPEKLISEISLFRNLINSDY